MKLRVSTRPSDTATPPDGLELIRERVSGAELVTLESAHLSNVECAEQFTAVVMRFLKA
jgi:3-oxoadipate enol-lactonase